MKLPEEMVLNDSVKSHRKTGLQLLSRKHIVGKQLGEGVSVTQPPFPAFF